MATAIIRITTGICRMEQRSSGITGIRSGIMNTEVLWYMETTALKAHRSGGADRRNKR